MNEYEIRAIYDDKSITVYQAYQKTIALPAIENKHAENLWIVAARSGEQGKSFATAGTHLST